MSVNTRNNKDILYRGSDGTHEGRPSQTYKRTHTEDQNLMMPTENDEQIPNVKQIIPVLTKLKAAVVETKFEDTISARLEASKIHALYLSRVVISITLICFGLITYEYWDPYDIDDKPPVYLVFHILMSILSVTAVVLYLVEIYHRGIYLKITGVINEQTNIFYDKGIFKIAVYCILLIIHPVYLKGDLRISSPWEGYFNAGGRVIFSRMHNEYLILIQFTVHCFTILYLVTASTEYAGPTMDRICRLSGCKNNFLFVMRALLVENPISLSMGLVFFSILYYSVAVRITENGFLRSTYRSDFDSDEEFEEVLIYRGIFWTYKNMIWNIFITMSTIGYGDIFVYSTFSRVMIFFVAITGLIVISIMIVAYSNFLELDNMQTSSFNFFNALELKISMRNEVSGAVNSFVRMFYAAREQKYSKYKKARITMETHIDSYKLMSNYYISMYGPNDIDSIKMSVIRADDALDNMMRYIYSYDEEVRKHVNELPDGLKSICSFLFARPTRKGSKPNTKILE